MGVIEAHSFATWFSNSDKNLYFLNVKTQNSLRQLHLKTIANNNLWSAKSAFYIKIDLNFCYSCLTGFYMTFSYFVNHTFLTLCEISSISLSSFFLGCTLFVFLNNRTQFLNKLLKIRFGCKILVFLRKNYWYYNYLKMLNFK